ncbi:hypothetical protein HELRODRAFT_178799 [Helobdella robusta]|uniref:Uncharacterized protein n=1 Tax=Helobdella robusta TaxID=6412 RepID=T1FDR2_HELRO|nr:hypothetical protein HELRODRAFT_178799 [Helobdella robusta]ESN95883.1 hypothetical protein HELRODRAFT_178799 [Helobdella robusta]
MIRLDKNGKMLTPFDSPIHVAVSIIVIFMILGLFMQSLAVTFLPVYYQVFILDLSTAFMLAGFAYQYATISVYYGFFYFLLFYIAEISLFPTISYGGVANPLDHLVLVMRKDYISLLRIVFQIIGTFISVTISKFAWNLDVPSFMINSISARKELETIDMHYMCRTPLKLAIIDGFLFEFFGAIVSLIIRKWKIREGEMEDHVNRASLLVFLKIHGAYSTNFIVNPLIIVSFYALCPHRLTWTIIIVYFLAPILGSLTAELLSLLPAPLANKSDID